MASSNRVRARQLIHDAVSRYTGYDEHDIDQLIADAQIDDEGYHLTSPFRVIWVVDFAARGATAPLSVILATNDEGVFATWIYNRQSRGANHGHYFHTQHYETEEWALRNATQDFIARVNAEWNRGGVPET